MQFLYVTAFVGIAVLIVAIIGLGGAITFGTASPPAPMSSISAPFTQVDFKTLPALERYSARDGKELAFRTYPGDPNRIAVMIHGSSADGASLHPLATAVNSAGYTAFTLDIRGHGASGPRGDISYDGQLDDDVRDFVDFLRARNKDAALVLVGFSSGGGFALRTAGSATGALFDRYVLISPALPYNAPTMRPNVGGWAAPSIPRIVALGILDRIGVHALDGLPVLAFAVDPNSRSNPTATYSYRLMKNFAAHADFRADIRAVSRPMHILVGGSDELLYSDQFLPLFNAERPDISVTILPNLGHIDMSLKPEALAAVVRVLRS